MTAADEHAVTTDVDDVVEPSRSTDGEPVPPAGHETDTETDVDGVAGPEGSVEDQGPDAEAADAAVAEAIARFESQRRPRAQRDRAVQHAARESMAAIEKFLGLARAKGNPGREKVWVGRVLKHRVKAWQLVYDFDADYAYVARMDRGVYLTAKGKVLFTVADSRPSRRHVAWKCDHRSLDTFLDRFAGEHDVLKTPLLHHRRLLEGIARICAEQHLDWG
ncbi:MAG: hypothetical protein R2726_20040 [Acidimicrobiales bacterium]